MVISKILDRDTTDGIKTTPNEVYGVSTHPLQGHVYEDVKSILQESSTL